MAFNTTSRPALRGRVLSKLPATLAATGGIAIVKLNGTWTIYPDFSALNEILGSAVSDPSSKQLWLYDPATDDYAVLTLQGLGDALWHATSTTSLSIGTGTKAFTTQAGKDFPVGTYVLAFSEADAGDFMVGRVTSYSGTTLTLSVTFYGGSGTDADWILRASAAPSATGVGAGDMISTNNGSDFASPKTAHDTLTVKGADVVAASTIDLDAATGSLIDITGNTTINAVTLAAGRERWCRLTGTPQITNGASLVVPGGTQTAQAGDFVLFRGYAAGVVRVATWTRADGTPLALSAASVAAAKLATSAIAQGVGMLNGTLSLSVGANALTIALKTLAGTDPSATDPVYFIVRTATGGYAVRTQSSALSLVISSGSTLGAASATPFRVWIVAFDDGGTVRLGAINCSKLAAGVATIYPLDEWNTKSSTAEGGAGAADSAGVVYTGSAVTTKNFTILGFADWGNGLTAAGTWDAAPVPVVLNGPGVPKPGQRVQRVGNETGAVATGTTVVPNDDTIPQNTEGDQYLSQAVTPSAKMNFLKISAQLYLASSVNGTVGISLFQDATAGALATAMQRVESAAGYGAQLAHVMLAATLSATTFNIRAGQTGAGTTTFNGVGGARLYGGVLASCLEIEEIMG